MEAKYFQLVDFYLAIESQFTIKLTNESTSFRIPYTKEADLYLKFERSKQLPELPNEGVWHMDRYYTCMEGTYVMYVRALPTDEPYVLVRYCSDSQIECLYLEKKELLYPEMSFIWNMIGLESVLMRQQALILHASFIKWDEKGILFSAPSGTGKSTQADLWQKYLGAEIINGDRAGIRKKDGVWRAYGLPYAGSSKIYRNESALLSAIVVLEQAEENSICPLGHTEAVVRLLPEFSLHRWDATFMNQAMDLITEIVENVPVYLLKCRPDKRAVEILIETIEKEEMK